MVGQIPPLQYIYLNRRSPIKLPSSLQPLESVITASVAHVQREGLTNRCHDAARLLGNEIMNSSITEVKFPDAHYFVVGSEGALKEGYGNFHNVGLLVVPLREVGANHYLAIDPHHNAHHSGDLRAGAVFQAGSLDNIYHFLSQHYSGRWSTQYHRRVTGRYLFLEGEGKTVSDCL